MQWQLQVLYYTNKNVYAPGTEPGSYDKKCNENQRHCYSIEFIGGEPLLYLNDGVKDLFEIFTANTKKIITTNGIKEPFLSSIDFLSQFDHINISRHRKDDIDNEKVFDSKGLLSKHDIHDLPEIIKERLRFNVTCHKSGMNNVDEMMDFIDTFSSKGIYQYMFANLNKLPDGFYQDSFEEFTINNRLEDKVFNKFEKALFGLGYAKIKLKAT